MNTQLGSWAELRHDNVLYVDEDSDDDDITMETEISITGVFSAKPIEEYADPL